MASYGDSASDFGCRCDQRLQHMAPKKPEPARMYENHTAMPRVVTIAVDIVAVSAHIDSGYKPWRWQ